MRVDPETQGLITALDVDPSQRAGGLITACGAGTVTASGLAGRASVGEVCLVERRRRGAARSPLFDERDALLAEIVGFGESGVQLLPYEEPNGIGRGARVALAGDRGMVRPSLRWRGRVLDAMARPIDGGPALPDGPGSLSGAGARHSPPSAGVVWERDYASACVRSTCSPPAATGSAWESSPAPASASRRSCR